MITPAFELTQDLDFLTVTIRVPYTRTSEFDLYMNGEDFKFYAKPYFLRLHLPGRIVEDGRESGTFDVDKGVFTVRVAKEIPGQHFEGLQMLTALLAPKGLRSARPLVEEIGKATILKCLLDIHRVFRESDPAYILNDLYISDYCIWIQKAKSKNIMNLTDLLRNRNIRKEHLELELKELEKAALLVLEEEESATLPDASKTEKQQNLICCKDTIGFSSKSSRETERFHPEKENSVKLACSSKKNEEESLDKLSGRSQENATSFAVSTTSHTSQSMDQIAPSRQILSDEDKDKIISESLNRKLVEELGEKLNSIVSISEDSTHCISESCAAEAKEESLVNFSLTNPSLTQRQILEVCPKRDPLLLLVDTTNDKEES
ncbi:SHQ1 protein, partial [Polypterus senegalus]